MIRLIDIFPDALREELGENPSVLCMRTVEQKYLVFSDDTNTPKFVLQPGTTENLSIVKDYTEQLHQSLPGRIPEPLAILRDHKNQSYLVQRGVAGVPWFTLRQRMGKDLPWDKILKQSINALVDFHKTTSSYAVWNKEINLQNHYRNLHLQAIEKGDSKLQENSLVCDHCIEALEKYSPMDCFPQHGDFSVNNLLFRSDTAGIIDFEQFGRVYLPMHDEFLLMGSLLQLHDSPSIKFAKTLWEEILASSRYEFSPGSKALDVLLMMHIMWWLIETHGQERRHKRRKTYLKALKLAQKEVLDNQPDFVEKILLMICR